MKIQKILSSIFLIICITNQINAKCCRTTMPNGKPDTCPWQVQVQICTNPNGTKSAYGTTFNGQIENGICKTCGHLPSDHYCDQSGASLTPDKYPQASGVPVTCPN